MFLCASLLVLVFCSGAPSDDKQAGKQPAAKPADKQPAKPAAAQTEKQSPKQAATQSDKAVKQADKQPAKQPDKNADPQADKNAEIVTKALAAMEKALNARDPEAIAAQFTPKGEFIDADDNVFDSHEAIAGEFKALFEVNPRKHSMDLTFDEVREISPGILSIDCTVTFTDLEGKDKDEDTEMEDIDFSALLVKQADGNWLFASVRSEGEGDLRTPHARLKQLEWLIGEWVDENDESSMHTKTRWSEDGNFIMADFTIHLAGRKFLGGTQRIGWDGSIGKFKSWVFDSEGGHAEGIWTEIEDAWVVKVTGVRPDGDACSATHTYERRGPDSFQFTVTDRIVGNEVMPDFSSQEVRKPPEPERATADAATTGKK
jgi:uncharacterized protein (TIGR02246 family)